MKTKVLSGLVCVAALATGCAHRGYGPAPERPQVLVTDGVIVVDQEPVVVARKPGEDAIVSWRLSKQSGFTFDKDGIVILGRIKDRSGRRVYDKSTRGILCRLGDTAPPAQTAAQSRDAPRQTTDQPNPLAYTCRIQPDALPGFYQYEINTLDPARRRVSSDPTLMI